VFDSSFVTEVVKNFFFKKWYRWRSFRLRILGTSGYKMMVGSCGYWWATGGRGWKQVTVIQAAWLKLISMKTWKSNFYGTFCHVSEKPLAPGRKENKKGNTFWYINRLYLLTIHLFLKNFTIFFTCQRVFLNFIKRRLTRGPKRVTVESTSDYEIQLESKLDSNVTKQRGDPNYKEKRSKGERTT
jgi:hypothetical protein